MKVLSSQCSVVRQLRARCCPRSGERAYEVRRRRVRQNAVVLQSTLVNEKRFGIAQARRACVFQPRVGTTLGSQSVRTAMKRQPGTGCVRPRLFSHKNSPVIAARRTEPRCGSHLRAAVNIIGDPGFRPFLAQPWAGSRKTFGLRNKSSDCRPSHPPSISPSNHPLYPPLSVLCSEN